MNNNHILSIIWLAFSAFFAWFPLFVPTADLDTCAFFAGIFLLGSLYLLAHSSPVTTASPARTHSSLAGSVRHTGSVRRRLARWIMNGSEFLLNLSARVADQHDLIKGAPLIISEATLHGHGSKHDPANDPATAPVTIPQLLDILDRSQKAKITMEIPRYRILVERVTPIDRFILEHAGREGTMPDLQPWVRPRDVL